MAAERRRGTSEAAEPRQGQLRKRRASQRPDGAACYPGAVAQQGRAVGVTVMANDRDARIAELEADVAVLRQREAALVAENVTLRSDSEAHDRALAEALEQQTALAEVLRVMAESPTEARRVLDAVAERALRLCVATHASLFLVD